MKYKIRKYIFYFLSLLLFPILIFIYLIYDSPKDASFINQIIRYGIFGEYQNLSVESKKNMIWFDSNNKEFVIELDDLNIIDKNKNSIIFADELLIKIDPLKILFNKSLYNEIYLKSPIIRLDIRDFTTNNKKIETLKDIYKIIRKYYSTSLKVENIKIVTQDSKNIAIDSIEGYVDQDIYKLAFNLLLDGSSFIFYSDVIMGDNDITLHINCQNTPLYFMFNYLSNLSFIKLLKEHNPYINLDVNLLVNIKEDGHIDNGDISISTSKQNVDIIKTKDLQITDFYTKLTIDTYGKTLHAENLFINFANRMNIDIKDLNISMDYDKLNIYKNHLSGLSLDGNITNVPVQYVHLLWPEGFVDETREWLAQNVKTGFIPQGLIKVDIDENDLYKKYLPADSIEASLEIKNSTVTYYESLPEVRGVDATALFTADNVIVTINSGHFLNSKVKKIKINVPFQEHPDKEEYITVEGQVSGPTKNIKSFLNAKDIEQIKHFYLDFDLNVAASLTNFVVNIPWFNTDSIIINASSRVPILKFNDKYSKYHITNNVIELDYNADDISIRSTGNINSVPYKMNWSSKDNNKNHVILTLMINKDNYINLNIMNSCILENGSFPLIINISDKNKLFIADLKNAEIKCSDYGFIKSKGDKLNAKIASDFENDNQEIYSLDINGPNININGKFSLYEDEKLKFLELSSVKYSNNNFSISYDGILSKLYIRGKSIDLSHIELNDMFKNNREKSNQDIDINTKKLYLRYEVNGTDFNMKIKSNKKGELDVLNGSLKFSDNTNFHISLIKKEQKNIINVTADNASNVFRGFNIYDNISGGALKMELTKNYNKDITDYYEGPISIYNFKISYSSFITQILMSLISPEGVLELFAGNKAIEAEKCKANIKIHNGILYINNGRIKGPSIEITMEGDINTNTEQVNLKGRIIPPLLGVNKLIGNIPIVGDRSGAVIAGNYTVSGNYKKVKTTVNPFSLLMPGFLRDIFD